MITLTLTLIYVSYFFIRIFSLSKREYPLYQESDEQDIERVSEKYPTLEKLKEAELALLKNEDDIQSRLDILTAYFFIHNSYSWPDAPKEHVRWLILNRPDLKIPWHELAFHFSMDKLNSAEVIELFKQKLNKHPHSIQIMENAANFSTMLDTDFAIQCFNTLASLRPWNSYYCDQVVYLTFLTRHRLPIRYDRSLLKLCKIRYRMSWCREVNYAVEYFKSNVFGYFYPNIIIKPMLRLMTKCHLIRKCASTYFNINFLNVAIENQDGKWVRKLGREIESRDKEMPIESLTFLVYASLARYAIFIRNPEKISLYMDKLIAISDSSDECVQMEEEKLIVELINMNEISTAKDYFSTQRFSSCNLEFKNKVEKMLQETVKV